MREGEVVQEGLEDGELGFEGLRIACAEGGAVGGVVVRLEAAGGEGGEAGGTPAVHFRWEGFRMERAEVKIWGWSSGVRDGGKMGDVRRNVPQEEKLDEMDL